MAVAMKLDLRGVALPVSLLKFKWALSELGPEEALDVLVHDPDVGRDVIRIMARSQDRVTSFTEEGDHYRVHIEPLSRILREGPGRTRQAGDGRSGPYHGVPMKHNP